MLEERIGEWRSYLLRRQAIDGMDVDELEDHLRTQVADLQKAGLDEEEAFLIAVKRIGDLDSLSREYAQLGPVVELFQAWRRAQPGFGRALRLVTPRPDRHGWVDQQLFDSLDDELFSELIEGVTDDSAASTATKGGESRAPATRPAPDGVDVELQRRLGGEDLGSAPHDNPLARVAESMRDAQQRIAKQDTSRSTQKIQEQIVADLEGMLRQLQQQCQACRAAQSQAESQPAGKAGEAQGQAVANSPAEESTTRLGQAETAETQANSQDSLLRQAWGQLPATVRQQMNSTAPEKFLPKYSKLIEDYFRRLSEERDE